MFRRKRNGYHAVEEHFEALKEDFDALQRDLRGLANGVQDVASAKFSGLRRNGEDLSEWTGEGVGNVRDAVREQPLIACALALSAGALLGAMLTRR